MDHLIILFSSSGFITKIFGLSEFALIGNWTILAFHGHKVTKTNNEINVYYRLFTFFISKDKVRDSKVLIILT